MSELKPCPFCGIVPTLGFNGTEDGGYEAVECPHCTGSDGVPFVGVHADSQEEAIRIWNTRPASPALDRLKEEIEGADHESSCARYKFSARKLGAACDCFRARALRIIEELKQ